MKTNKWLTGWCTLAAAGLFASAAMTIKVDPYFHYHKPNTDKYFYELENERSQNDGISRHFDYDAIIIGSSMCENFKTSEMDELFGVKSVKLPYPGATYKEITDSTIRALEYNPDIKIVVRGLDMVRFADNKDALRTDLGKFPFYLYDNNPFNDEEYLFNREVLLNQIVRMEIDRKRKEPGITSFDDYLSFVSPCGIGSVCPDGLQVDKNVPEIELSDGLKDSLKNNIEQNVVELARQYPEVDFYYFFTPYSAVWWGEIASEGKLRQQVEQEKMVIEAMLQCDNIKLFSINSRTDLTTDINNYSDERHYGFWINSLVLKCMKEGKCQLTKDNYEQYLKDELEFYESFDFNELTNQSDYSNDYYADALIRNEITGVTPHLEEEPRKTGDVIIVDDAAKYKYLVFTDARLTDGDLAEIYIYDENGEIVKTVELEYNELNSAPRLHVVNIENCRGQLSIVFGKSDCAEYEFNSIGLY